MTRVKIIGAGSIGNHLAHAARSQGWDVDIYDRDPEALNRTQNMIYPSRYGVWDDAISLYSTEQPPSGSPYDAVFIGTPPDTHMDLAIAEIGSGANLVHVEKPVCTPDLRRADELVKSAQDNEINITVGYDLLLGKSFIRMEELARDLPIGEIQTIDVETREHWGGIFGAHPWLDGPSDSYLGYWQRGGGAAGEHSHGLNMWQHLAHSVGAGRVADCAATADYVREGSLDYDQLMAVNLRTESGLVGRCVQDVVTQPARKWARVQGSAGFVEWEYNAGSSGQHLVRYGTDTQEAVEESFPANRPDDFIVEIVHLEGILSRKVERSPIDISRGMDTMLLIAAAHKSAEKGRTVRIDYQTGYNPDALR